ncbi:bifunctional demethylmenaquinone methyltransferase/2-methoxy-6-polyprenyl-1,4-benzoquinol methylase UbiE [Campylobacter sp. MIT 99-7217]|uniref:bifunctional demethylmenaquinone methyltransferase/2-methoxy-6-polyprenyl-1,4-benzoquinol methylase UbiE n=1 Tax=Campylobacter sp. MIT 99-7217 TaxID=535091 RepID=UPI00115954A5|nr:bifunctional demethylmenaquinone methyltransferase/2-methoxy-6-polyprenyl-1,4-benzoquinol methylase UbiE [Campylobacter sp. MIT 99-7217]TQR33666.1 bifunctional demethylmenaquinone methyltransferase/2-methoxy-6-polyprenyl-1,4-benzoquinol methylase UbiE [Campylobacter sp. MIT 99-7217]
MQEQEKIIKMFDDIAPTYDKANRILSFGIDIKWRKKGCQKALACFEDKNLELQIADIACGTGDLILTWQDKARQLGQKIQTIIGVDPSEKMLELAQKKIENAKFIKASATKLPFDDRQMDILSISYGIRNVLERKRAWQEFARVLRKDGILLVLEFTKPSDKGILRSLSNFYLHTILPKIGGFISKNKAAYEYLPSSIEAFITKDDFIKELDEAGFDIVFYDSFSFGISSMFVAKKR